jgi:AraC-like DNA-binding protein
MIILLPYTMEVEVPDKFIQQVNSLLDEHISQAYYRISDLARDLKVSRVHLYRKVKAITGKSCSRYILDRRLERAHKLLKQTNHTVTEIAYEVGFNNLSYFARAFKARYHVNPSKMNRT